MSRVKSTVMETVRTLLVGDPGVAALVGSRVFPVEMPQGSELPAVVCSVVSSVPESSLTGDVATTLKSSRVQVDCYARPSNAGGGYAQAHELARAVELVLGNLSDHDLGGVAENSRDLFDNVTQHHRVSLDFTIWS